MRSLATHYSLISRSMMLMLAVTAACTDAEDELDETIPDDMSGQSSDPEPSDNPPEPTTGPTNPTANYYPLAVGNRWDFVTSDQKTFRIDVVDFGVHQQRPSYEVHGTLEGWWWPTTAVSYEYTEGGDSYLFIPGLSREWARSMEGPPEDGQQWSYDIAGSPRQFAWEYEGTISVPAGTFHDCYRLVNLSTSLVDYTVYAPNVGPVYSVSGSQTRSLTNLTTL
ncbi:MAG: hypothetical protein AB7R00_25815 [Kofleriaceae bacterium]